jgi:oxygen-independent coproporphyrinogen-3 oxidase
MLESTPDNADPEIDVIGRVEAFEESLFLGLRLKEGVDLSRLREQFGGELLHDVMPALLEVCDAGLVELNSDRAKLTPRGRLVSNEVFSRLLVTVAA